MALKLLVDTCIWLDLAKDYREQPVVAALRDLVDAGEVDLVIPAVVIDEFRKNKDRVIGDARRSLQSHFRLVREAVARFGDVSSKSQTIASLHEIDHKLVIKGDAVYDTVDQIEKLIGSATTIQISDEIKRRVTERALSRRAPYHRDRNSVADAILIETYSTLVEEPGEHTFAFVTHNTKDFSDPNGDRRQPHPDLAPLFGSSRSTYHISLVELVRSLDPELVADHDFQLNANEQARRLSEILEAEHLLFRQVWYNRHWNLRIAIEEGRHKVVPNEDYSRAPYRPDETLDTVWAGALAAAKRTEEEVGLENLGPWDDFEWGMINGKLSALRWVLGDDWDMLDT